MDCWLATARQENIVSLKGVNGYNPIRIARETCISYFSYITTKKPRHLMGMNVYTGLSRYVIGIIFIYTLQTEDLFLASDSEP